MTLRARFWEKYDLADLSPSEWEALCDGCGKCCLIKLEDEDTGALAYTNIACRLFDDATCKCGNYPLRRQLVAGCIVLTPENIAQNAAWMPSTCAYRLLEQGSPLPAWHPLLTGDPNTVETAGVSMKNRTVPEGEVEEDEYEDYIQEGLQ